jgi:hypothetical protein
MDSTAVNEYLAEVKTNILENLDDFKESEAAGPARLPHGHGRRRLDCTGPRRGNPPTGPRAQWWGVSMRPAADR